MPLGTSFPHEGLKPRQIFQRFRLLHGKEEEEDDEAASACHPFCDVHVTEMFCRSTKARENCEELL